MKLDELDTFQMYLAIKNHFTTDYDFFKYKGRLKNSVYSYENLLKKNYHGAIYKLSKTYDAKHLCGYFVSNMLVQDGKHLFDVDSEGKRIYADFIRRMESRSYIFKQDVNRVCMELNKSKKTDFWDSTHVYEGQHPLLFRMFVGSYLAPETMCILYQMKDFITEWDNKINDPVFYPVVVKQIRKLSPFVNIKNYDVFNEYIESAIEEHLN
jgi:hypothetical protein